jgi:radical SAM superfamily enzyme YgiQ (UPF0313 family)
VQNEHPQLTAFSCTTSQFPHVKQIARHLKAISDTFIVCGGVHATLQPDVICECPHIDAVIRGEGEFPMRELAAALERNEPYEHIKNLWVRADGGIVKNSIRPLIRDLDRLPFPDKTALDYQRVIDEAGGVNRFIFSRGCPFECSYCSNKALSGLYGSGPYFRQRSPQSAIREIQLDMEKYSFRFVTFDDDTMSLNKGWFYEFFSLYAQHIPYPFRCNLRVGTVDEDMIRLLKDAGVNNVAIGIEHGNERFRKEVLKRNMSNRDIVELFRLCARYGVKTEEFIMVGFPYETKQLFLDTVKLCRAVSAKGGTVIFHPYPKTELGELCAQNGWLPEKDHFREREEAVISYPAFSKEDIQMCNDVSWFLIRYKCIPLCVPLKWPLYLYKSLRKIKRTLPGF